MSDTPPFTVSSKAIHLVAEISAQMERLSMDMENAEKIRLRQVNRMKTIHGSLAIEGNSLTEEQVTALIDGKHIVAPVKEMPSLPEPWIRFCRDSGYDIPEDFRSAGKIP